MPTGLRGICVGPVHHWSASAWGHAIQLLSTAFAEMKNTAIAEARGVCHFCLSFPSSSMYLIWLNLKGECPASAQFQPCSVVGFWFVSTEQLLKSQLFPKRAAKSCLRWPPMTILLLALWDVLSTLNTSSGCSYWPKLTNNGLAACCKQGTLKVDTGTIIVQCLYQWLGNDSERQNFTWETPG